MFKAFGTPTAKVWPALKSHHVSIAKLPFWDTPEDVGNLVPRLCDAGRHLFKAMMVYDPLKRICAASALEHPYFTRIRDERRTSSGAWA
ncbi:unnamed protein product [Notodromas monacha]|nr:unnamed protein product [Notodromas monacha]CAG0914901.1 unnamed protein product [Notodromas monacha]